MIQSGERSNMDVPRMGSLLVTETIREVTAPQSFVTARFRRMGRIFLFGGQRTDGVAVRFVKAGAPSNTTVTVVSHAAVSVPSETTTRTVWAPSPNTAVNGTAVAVAALVPAATSLVWYITPSTAHTNVTCPP